MEPEKKVEPPSGVTQARRLVMATDLPFALVGPIVVGGFIGYWLDQRFSTKPLFLVLLGIFGFYAGLRGLFSRLKEFDRTKNGKQG